MAAKKTQKYIFVIGGVMSGVGKGVTTSSIAKILKARGFKVNPMKIDPYLNVDAGTMNPIEHGEVFVLDSGLETDQDMGNYERFLDQTLPAESYMTSGMVYKYVIDQERALKFGGKCVEPLVYIAAEILRRIDCSVEQTKSDITIIEVGGTLGEYQNAIFFEAARMLKLKNPQDVAFVLVSYLPVPSKIGEMKTKPTQYAVREMNSYGINPDIIIARSEVPLDRSRKEKIAISSGIPTENIISAPDIDSIYDIPINFEKDNLSDVLLKLLHTKPKQTDLKEWRAFADKSKKVSSEIKIAVVGKYFKTGDFVLSDVYISVIESLKHAAVANNKKLKLEWLDSGEYDPSTASGQEIAKKIKGLKDYDGILVPGGFGERGIEGKIAVIKYCRENKIPYFGLCYGMQLLVIEYARNILGLKAAHTVEINPDTKYPVIDVMPEQKEKIAKGDMGGSMRLGAYPCVLKPSTIALRAYGTAAVSERHRHRYEVNPDFVDQLSADKNGLIFSGTSPDGRLMEIAELSIKMHPFMLGTQFHPEFKSSPLNPHPLFVAFVKACLKK